jgi:hypothetical protein
MSRAEFRQRNFLLHCQTCGAGFYEMQKLLKHRERCQGDAQKQARSDERDAGQPDLPAEPSATAPAATPAGPQSDERDTERTKYQPRRRRRWRSYQPSRHRRGRRRTMA